MVLVMVPLRAKLIMSKRMPTSTVKACGCGVLGTAAEAARGKSRRDRGAARNARRERRNCMAERDCTANRRGSSHIGFSLTYDTLVPVPLYRAADPWEALREALCEDLVAWRSPASAS